MHRNHRTMLKSKLIQQTFRLPAHPSSLYLVVGEIREKRTTLTDEQRGEDLGRREAEVEILTHERIGGTDHPAEDEPRKSSSAENRNVTEDAEKPSPYHKYANKRPLE